MATMKSVQTGAVDKIDVVDVERPVPGPKDALMKIRACGICGTDTFFLHIGGGPFGPGGAMTPVPSATSRPARSSRSARRSRA